MNGPESHGAVGGPRPFVMEIRCHIHHLNLIHRVLRRVSVVLTDAANTRTRVGDADQGDEHAPSHGKGATSAAASSWYRKCGEAYGVCMAALNDLLSLMRISSIPLRVHPFPPSSSPFPPSPQRLTSLLLSCRSTAGPRSCRIA